MRLVTRHGWDAIKVELAEKVVVTSHGSLSLKNLDEDARLVIRAGGEGLGRLGGGSGIALLVSVVLTPPAVSRPREKGVTSSKRSSEIFLDLSQLQREWQPG